MQIAYKIFHFLRKSNPVQTPGLTLGKKENNSKTKNDSNRGETEYKNPVEEI